MVYRTVLLGLALGVAQSAHAAETKLSGDEIATALTERSLYADGVEQIFRAGGQTVYIDHSNASQGLWKIEAGRYCSQWPPSQTWSCYDVTRDGETITFVGAGGTRYPMRVKP